MTNGAMGVLVDIVASGADTVPLCALVRFDSYTGPALFPDDPKLVPVPPHTAQFGADDELSRTNLPLCLAWAITIHKSQGQTYDMVVVNLGSKELSLGLTYVALSRARTIDGLMLVGNYSMDRIMRINLHPRHEERESAEAWLDALGAGA